MNSLTLETAHSTTGSVISVDGTVIGYRQLGSGPKLILVHGGMQASQNFLKLSEALADTFTVYVVDRRGRGMSGKHGDHYSVAREVEDIQALVDKTGTRFIFGLSSGAIVTLQTALMTPALQKVAVYEPPLPVDEKFVPDSSISRFEQALSQGNLAGAMSSIIKGIDDSPMRLLPRFILEPILRMGIADNAKETNSGDIPFELLIPTMHYDFILVNEMRGKIDRYKGLQADLLLMGGTRSRPFLKIALNYLSGILPHAQRVIFPGVGHLAADNDGKPQVIAGELKRFFSEL